MSNKWIDVKGSSLKGNKGLTPSTAKKPVSTAVAKRSSATEAVGSASAANTVVDGVTEGFELDASANNSAHVPSASSCKRTVSCTSGAHSADLSVITPRARTPTKIFGDEHLVSTVSVDAARASNPPASPSRELNPYTAMSRYKTMVHDILQMLSNPSNSRNIDTFIELTEEALKDLKKLKVQARNTVKPKNSAVSLLAASATNAEVAKDDDAKDDVLASSAGCLLGSSKPIGKSWASLLQKPPAGVLRSPSKKDLRHVDPNNTSGIALTTEADRLAAAAKAESRRLEASERRGEKGDDAKAHNLKVAERVQEVKQRQKEETEAAAKEAKEKHDQAIARHEENIEAIRDKATKHSQRVDEVLFVNEMNTQNKAMRIESKSIDAEHALEVRKEEQKQIAQQRTEAREAALERSKELSQQKVEKAKEREAQRLEQVKRLEEQKKTDAESRQAKSGEREKKLQDLKQAAAVEAETKKQRVEERLLKSQQNREEQRANDVAKRKEKDLKTKERLAEPAQKITVSEVMAKETPAEEEQVNTRLAKASASIARHAKVFVEQYQKECVLGIKDLNKSKFRALSTRLLAASGSMSRQVLNDMTNFLTSIDHEYARYFNLFEHIMSIMTEARKSEDHGTFKLCSEFLHKLLLDVTEGSSSARYFVRAGHVVPLLNMIHEEIKTLQCHNRSACLTVCFSLLQCCVQSIVTDASSNIKIAPIRDQLMELLEVAGVDKFCFAIASTCVDAEDMACLQYALLTLQLQIFLIVKKKADTGEWYETATVSLFTLLQNILNPGGVRAKDDAITHNTMLVILTSFRLLNIIARHKPCVIGTLLRDNESARMELFHTVGAFFGYVSRNETAVLERIPTDGTTCETSVSKSFEDAWQFGMTLQNIPRAQLPNYNIDGTNFTPPPSSARSSVSQTSTINGGGGKGITRAAIHELLLFIGIAAIGEPKVQEIFSWGKERPLLQVILTALNINYFNKGRHILFPTVLSIIARDPRNRVIAEREMDCKVLYDFLTAEVQCLPQKQQKKIKSSDVVATPVAGPAASPAPPPPPPLVAEGPKRIFAFNWADMTDSDDDDTLPATASAVPASATEEAAPSTASTHEGLLQLKKEKMLQLIKNCTNYNLFFRIENRIPRAMWSDIGRFLEESVAEE